MGPLPLLDRHWRDTLYAPCPRLGALAIMLGKALCVALAHDPASAVFCFQGDGL
jgi:hypothetical protein